MDKEFNKLHESGVPLSSNVNYKVKIKRGRMHIDLSPLPDDIYVSYELLNEYFQPIDSHGSSYETECSFPLKTLGVWSIRLNFYESQKTTIVRYSFQTISIDFDEKQLLNTFNFKEEERSFAISRLERVLYSNRITTNERFESLAQRLIEMITGYTLVDYLVERETTLFYFYCDSDHYDLGKYLYYMFYMDSRIEVKECISKLPYTVKDIKFRRVNSLVLDKKIPIFIISPRPEKKLENYFSERGNISFSLANVNVEIQKYYPNEVMRTNPNKYQKIKNGVQNTNKIELIKDKLKIRTRIKRLVKKKKR